MNDRKVFDKEKVAKNLYDQRIRMHYQTQGQLAEAANLNLESVSRYERGERLPKADVLFSLCGALACDADYLIGRQDLPNHRHSDIKETLPILSKNAIEGLATLSEDAKQDRDSRIVAGFIDYMICAILDEAGYYYEEENFGDLGVLGLFDDLLDLIKIKRTLKKLDNMTPDEANNMSQFGTTFNRYEMIERGTVISLGESLSCIANSYAHYIAYPEMEDVQNVKE